MLKKYIYGLLILSAMGLEPAITRATESAKPVPCSSMYSGFGDFYKDCYNCISDSTSLTATCKSQLKDSKGKTKYAKSKMEDYEYCYNGSMGITEQGVLKCQQPCPKKSMSVCCMTKGLFGIKEYVCMSPETCFKKSGTSQNSSPQKKQKCTINEQQMETLATFLEFVPNIFAGAFG